MKTIKELKIFIILWLTQAFSSLGSSMTGFALVVWLYSESGSALASSLLAVCSYAPYVAMSIFAGAISDKWNKKTIMLVSDSFAAVCTALLLVLLKTGQLQVWHLYALNALNGLMNSVQSPAADVAATLLTPEKHYQKTSGMRSFSNSLVSILTPVLATWVTAAFGLDAVIAFDLMTFTLAFVVLAFFIRIPAAESKNEGESLLQSARRGVEYLRGDKGILWMILFLSAINLIASVYDAALPAMVLSKKDEAALGIVSGMVGIATLIGSVVATLLPEPKSRIKTVCACLMISMSTENFLLALSESTVVWCVGAVLGWLVIPVMSANYDGIFRSRVPVGLQGRVYSVRNTLQFFTIPLGYLIGGFLVDEVFEPFMAHSDSELLCSLFGESKGAGAALLFMVLGVLGVAVCIIFSNVKYIKELEQGCHQCLTKK